MPSDQGFDHSDVDAELDTCIRDDSTECDCPRCAGAEDRFWREQGEQDGELDDDRDEPDDPEDRP